MFELPISITNSITGNPERVECDLLENTLIDRTEVDKSSDELPEQPWVQSGVQTGAAPSLAGTRRILVLATALTMIWSLLN